MLGFNTISGAPLSALIATPVDVTVNLTGVAVGLALGLSDVTAAATTAVDSMQVTLGLGNLLVVDLSWVPVDDSQTAVWIDVIPRN